MSKKNQVFELLEDAGVTGWAKEQAVSVLAPYVPTINQQVSQEIQNLTTQLLSSKSEELLSQLPNPTIMAELGRSIGLRIV